MKNLRPNTDKTLRLLPKYSKYLTKFCLCLTVVKTRVQSLKKGVNEETYNGVVDCIRWLFFKLLDFMHLSNIVQSHSHNNYNINTDLSFALQKYPEKRGSWGFSKGGRLPSPGHRSTLWHRPGCVLCGSWRVPTRVHTLQHILCINDLFPDISGNVLLF